MLENLKIKLMKIAKDAERFNLCSEKTGSFSIRDVSSGYVITTPYNIKFENLTEEQVSIIDLSEKKIKVIGGIEPNRDVLMHVELYKARKDIKAIMHVNPIYTTTFSVISKVIPPILCEAKSYGGYIYVAKYDNTKNIEPGRDVIEKLKTSDACLLESNGVIVISKNIEDILCKAKEVERVAEIYYKSLIANKFNEPKRFSGEELKEYKL